MRKTMTTRYKGSPLYHTTNQTPCIVPIVSQTLTFYVLRDQKRDEEDNCPTEYVFTVVAQKGSRNYPAGC